MFADLKTPWFVKLYENIESEEKIKTMLALKPEIKVEVQSYVMEIAALQIAITDNIFKLSRSDQELIRKLQIFRDHMLKLSDDLSWLNKKN